MVCIVLNTIVLSLDHYGISDKHAQLLETFNTCFTVIFICDVIVCNIVYDRQCIKIKTKILTGTTGFTFLLINMLNDLLCVFA